MEYLVNEKGERTRVVLSIEEYEELVEAREELEDARDHEQAMEALANGEEKRIPFEQAQHKIGSEYAG